MSRKRLNVWFEETIFQTAEGDTGSPLVDVVDPPPGPAGRPATAQLGRGTRGSAAWPTPCTAGRGHRGST